MKKTHHKESRASGDAPSPASEVDATCDVDERFRLNEAFFATFMDLVPSRIYFNPDDRRSWMRMMLSNHHADATSTPTPTSTSSSGKRKAMDTDDGDEDDGEDDDDNMDDDQDEDDFAAADERQFQRTNRFDTRIFKSVSQILADLANHHQHSQRSRNAIAQKRKEHQQQQQQQQQQLAKAAAAAKAANSADGGGGGASTQVGEKLASNTAIKVFNKSQNKSPKSATTAATTDSAAAESPANIGSNKSTAPSNGTVTDKKAAKRASKARDERREMAKKQRRQRYDSQSEPQILSIDHSEANSHDKQRKPILNKQGQVVFSKFDFTADKTIKSSAGSASAASKSKTANANVKPKDYKKVLKQLEEERERKEQLRQVDPAKADELESKAKWRAAIDKASGVKVKDDVDMLRRAVKRQEKKKEKAKKGWAERVKQTEEKKNKVQEKRRANIDKRKEKNREQKMKRLKKKGRVLPGF